MELGCLIVYSSARLKHNLLIAVHLGNEKFMVLIFLNGS